MFLLGVNDTPSDEERNQCASAFVLSTISEDFESRSLRGGFSGGFGGGPGGVTERFSATSKSYPVERTRLFGSNNSWRDQVGHRLAPRHAPNVLRHEHGAPLHRALGPAGHMWRHEHVGQLVE
jgi:hypothetical protein